MKKIILSKKLLKNWIEKEHGKVNDIEFQIAWINAKLELEKQIDKGKKLMPINVYNILSWWVDFIRVHEIQKSA